MNKRYQEYRKLIAGVVGLSTILCARYLAPADATFVIDMLGSAMTLVAIWYFPNEAQA